MPAPVSREYRIYLALWRKAYLHPEQVVEIKASTYWMAMAMRQGLYRAIRPFRHGEADDAELYNAAEKYVAYLEKGEDLNAPHKVVLKERKSLAELNLAELRLEEEDLQLGEERQLQTRLAQFIEKDDKPAKTTPFYTRED